MKVIFLDIDGVLNVIPKEFDNYGGIFHDHFVDNLKRIIDETNAKIVISSTWRYSGLNVMKKMWESRGLPGEVIDITPDSYLLFNEGFNDGEFESLDDISRGNEIDYWLARHPEVVNYVIIDDDSDFLPNQLNNFVMTSNNIYHPDCIDIGYGLTKECSNKVIRILNEVK